MASTTTTTSQRLKLESTCSRMVYELLGLPPPEASAGAPNGSKRGAAAASASTPKAGSAGGGNGLLALERGLRHFYDRLPYNHGAQLCIEDLLSYLRHLKAGKPQSGAADLSKALLQYLELPDFVEHLATFGKLPGHPYILVFDPYGYQSKTPPTEEQSRAIDPVAFAESAAGGTNTMMPSKAELKLLDQELDEIFNEKLQKTGMKCPKCKESKFMRYHEVQRRSADEGSSYLYHCANCNHSGRSR